MNKKIKEKLGKMGYHRVRYPYGHPDDKTFTYFWTNSRVPYGGQMSERDLNELIKYVEEQENE